jgi:uncharacterized membrane protein AbrB (regulator of aidB expression)
MDFDFQTAAFGLAVLSTAGIGLIMAGSFLWPDQTERYKKMIPQVLVGLILTIIASTLIGFFGG